MKTHTTRLFLSILFSFSVFTSAFAQLGFCSGSKGDPIFHEDFGSGSGTGSPLAPGITSYSFKNGDPQDGSYTISDQFSGKIRGWHRSLPKTTKSNGRALIVNADYTAGLFYQTKITGLCENASYEFSAFLMNIYSSAIGSCSGTGIPINVRFEIWDSSDNRLLKKGSTGDIPGTAKAFWKRYGMTFQSEPGQNSIILKMFNNSDGGCGNDLAIDDIIFRSCGDLTSIESQGSVENESQLCEENLPQAITLTANPDESIYSDHYYQWQQSSDGSDWSNISGANQKSYSPTISTNTYFRVQVAQDPINLADNLCSTFSEPYAIKVIPTPPAPRSNGDVMRCQQDSPTPLSVNIPSEYQVNWYKTETSTTPLATNTTTFTPESNGDYYAEAYVPDAPCAAGPRTKLNYQLLESPQLEPDETLQICKGDQVKLSTALKKNVTYKWSNGATSSSILVSEEGEYHLTVTNANECTASRKFEVSYIIEPEIADVSVKNGSIKILTTQQEGNFLYSIDDKNYQTSNSFQVNEGGVYTVYVKDKSGCSIAKKTFPVLLYPKFITPNKDGYNDVLRFKGIEYFSTSEVSIFDRFGKLLIRDSGKDFSWDGTYKGETLPSAEYWFMVKISGQKTIKGHFSLIR